MNGKKTANNPFAQVIFDCREILLPKGSGKGGQRRRSDLRNILFTIATEGEHSYVEGKSKNGLWWTMSHLQTHTGIGRTPLRNHLEWLIGVGLVRRIRRMNSSPILWVNSKVLRDITSRQQADRATYKASVVADIDGGLIDEDEKMPELDPADLESRYFPIQEVISEALPEAPYEEQTEARYEALPETHTEELTEEQMEALAEAEADAQTKARVLGRPYP